MEAVGFGALMIGVLLIVVALFVWQAVRRSAVTEYAEYVVPEAADFVFAHLSDRAHASLDPETVRRVLEWNLEFSQILAPRHAVMNSVVGSGDGLDHVLDRAAEAGVVIDPFDVAEIMTLETEYLLSIGAIGAPVGDDEL
jgi:hypothetical protein